MKKGKIILVIIIITLAFIWGNSMESRTTSQEKSLGILEMITPYLEFFVGKGNVTDHFVRKLAHLAEFGLLGCEFMLFSAINLHRNIQSVCNCLFAGLSAAVIDESIQIFSGRGSQVQDVLLDFFGATAGILFVVLLFRLFGLLKKHTKKSE